MSLLPNKIMKLHLRKWSFFIEVNWSSTWHYISIRIKGTAMCSFHSVLALNSLAGKLFNVQH